MKININTSNLESDKKGEEIIEITFTDDEDSKKEVDISEKIYNALEIAEKIAIKLAQINIILKKAKKKRRKKNKKLGKIDKKTGTLILKKTKKIKSAKALKRYSPSKKK